MPRKPVGERPGVGAGHAELALGHQRPHVIGGVQHLLVLFDMAFAAAGKVGGAEPVVLLLEMRFRVADEGIQGAGDRGAVGVQQGLDAFDELHVGGVDAVVPQQEAVAPGEGVCGRHRCVSLL